jgi:arginase
MAELALVTGRGQALLTTYDGRCPLVRDEDVVAFGFRDEWEAQSYGSPPLAEKIKAIGLEEVRRMGLGPGAREALADVSGQDRCDFGIHFDADALDDAIMPAVDYRLPGGLSWLEIKTHSQCCTCSSESGRHGGHNFQSEARHRWESFKRLRGHADRRVRKEVRTHFPANATE